MYQDSALVERPSCSSTRNQSVIDQPWPPCSRACRPPDRPAAIASRLMRSISSSGSRPPLSLGELLVRDQHLVDEAARTLLQVDLLGGEAVR